MSDRMLERFRLVADRRPWVDGVQLYFWQHLNGAFQYGSNVVMMEHKENSYTEPLIHLSGAASQELMDTLWQCGIRPSQAVDSAGELSATKRHLDDLRRCLVAAVNKDRLIL